MTEQTKFTPEEQKVVHEYLDTERVRSFAQNTWPLIFFMIPSFFLFCVFLSDGFRASGVIAYIGLLIPYALLASVMRSRTVVLNRIICKYEARLAQRGEGESE